MRIDYTYENEVIGTKEVNTYDTKVAKSWAVRNIMDTIISKEKLPKVRKLKLEKLKWLSITTIIILLRLVIMIIAVFFVGLRDSGIKIKKEKKNGI